MSRVLTFACVAEAATGAALVVAPSLVCRLLLGVEASGVTADVARVAGIAIVSLSVACWPAPANARATAAMTLYGAGVGACLTYLGLRGMSGPALWPAVALHAALCVALPLSSFSSFGKVRTS